MRFTVEKSVLRAIAVVAATCAVIAVMQVHLWQVPASSLQAAAESAMPLTIHDLYSNGYTQHLPVLEVESPI